MKRHTGILRKFLAAFMFVGIVAILLAGLQMYFSAKEMILDSKKQNLESMRNMKKQQIESFLSSMRLPVQAFSSYPSTITALKELSSAFNKLPATISEKNIEECKLRLLEYYEKTGVGVSLDAESEGTKFIDFLPDSNYGVIAQCAYLQNSGQLPGKILPDVNNDINIKNYQKMDNKHSSTIRNVQNRWQFLDILMLDKAGNIISSSEKHSDLGENVYNDNWLGSSLRQAHQFAIGATDYDDVKFFDFSMYAPASNKPVMFVSSAVADLNGEIIGAVISILGSSPIDQILSGGYRWEKEGFGLTGEAYVIGSDYTMRSNTRELITDKNHYLNDLKKTTLNPLTIGLIDIHDTTVLYQQVPEDIAALAISGETGYGVTQNYMGHTAVTAYAPLNLPDLEWGIIVDMNEQEMLDSTAHLKFLIIRAAIIVFIIILMLTYVLAVIFTKPVLKMQESVLKIAEGDLNFRVEISGEDEFRDLADAFNLMVRKLKEHADENARTTRVMEDEIEERIATENELKNERNFVSTVLNSNGMIVIVIDPADNVIRINDSGLVAINAEYWDVINTNYYTFVPDQYKEAVKNAIHITRTTGGRPYISSELFLPKDKVIYVDWTFSLINSEHSSDSYIVVIGIDVSERNKIQESLRENEEMLQTITSFAQDAIIVSGSSDNIIMWNEAASRMFGYRFEDIKGKPVTPTIIPEEYEGEFIDEIHNGVTLELYGVKSNGERFPIELSISKVKIRATSNTLYIIRDVSSRKNRELELYKALEKARVAEKAKGEFLANMSHEIRTPLNGIVGFLSLLKHTPLQDTQIEYLNIINTSADSLLGIINEILDFSKIESGKMELEAVEFDSLYEFEQVVELYVAKANEKAIDLVVQIDPVIPQRLVGDPLRLRQILSNLLSNAIKFTENSGTVTLAASILNSDNDFCKLRISVTDTGIGISNEKQALIFDAFSQADSSVTRKYGGSGLGLAICSKLTKLIGSGLQVTSEEGKGSEFSFIVSFPIAKSDPVQRQRFDGIFIAMFDCQHAVCNNMHVAKRYLSALGCQYSVFKDIEEMKSLDNIDVVMTGYSPASIDIVNSIIKEFPKIGKIFVASDLDRQEVTKLDNDKVKSLIKPINMSKLVNTLTTLLVNQGKDMGGNKIFVESTTVQFSGKVLVAEDNFINRRLVDIMLKRFGLDVDLVENGRDAVIFVKKNKYDIIFMDIHMPVLDGVSATGEIIAWELENELPHTPIIALTANVIKEDQESYFRSGLDGFLAKPLEAEKLEGVLFTYLGNTPHTKKLNNADTFVNLGVLEEVNEYDEDVYLAISGLLGLDDMDVVKHILFEYCTMSESQIDEMRAAVDKKNMGWLSSIAHNVKGSSMNLRFDKITAYAELIEFDAKDQKDSDYYSIIDAIEREFNKLKLLIG